MGTWIFPMENYLDFSNSILPVLIALLVFMVIRKLRPGKPTVISVLFGFLFSICMVFGAQLDQKGSVPFMNPWMWLSILAFAVVMTLMVSGLWSAMAQRQQSRVTLPHLKASREICRVSETQTGRTEGGAFFLLRTGGVIFLLYFVVFLAVYPGFFVYDAQEEYLEVVTRSFTTHHPLFHVLMLGGIVQLVYKLTGSVNLGIAAYTLFQMAALSLIFGYFIWKLGEHGLRKRGQWILTLYLGICPPLVMFSLCSAKDGLFMGMLLIQVLLLLDLCEDVEAFWADRKKMLLFAVSAILMMLFRHNGCYAFLAFLPFLAAFVKKKAFSGNDRAQAGRRSARLLAYGVLLICLYLILNKGLAFVTKASGGEHQEMLTVPIMQLARTYAYGPDAFTQEDREVLFRYLPEDALQRYTPKVSDGVKISFSNAAYEENSGDFWKLWAGTLIHHPFSYVNAWLMTSYGFWYPDTVIDVYRGNTVFTYTYEDSSYFGYEVEEPGARTSFLPALDELYRRMSLTVFQQKVPFVSMLFSPGFLFWCMLFGLGFLLDQKEHGRYMEVVLPFLLPILVFLTFLLGPTYLVRYVVFWWVLVPLLAVRIYVILNSQR